MGGRAGLDHLGEKLSEAGRSNSAPELPILSTLTAKETIGEPPSVNVKLYTRKSCHLCDAARDMLVEHGVEPQLIDIDENRSLCERFDTCVPVVEIDGKVRFRGRVEPVLLKRLLSAGS